MTTSPDRRKLPIPPWTEQPDYFVWEAFDGATVDPARRLAGEALQQEALLAETEHLYVIPDQFGVVRGHVLIIPKTATTSFAGFDPRHDDEVTWLLAHISNVVADACGGQVVLAEHGECGCASAGQAHMHLLPIPASVTTDQLSAAVDQVLRRRMVGVEHIVYHDTAFTAPEDLHWLIDADGAEIVGAPLRVEDLLRPVCYPADARTASGLQQPYVYFAGPGVELLSTCSFRSQFVREVVALVSDLRDGSWDRRANTSRANMFATHDLLAPALRAKAPAQYGFLPRSGAWVRDGA